MSEKRITLDVKPFRYYEDITKRQFKQALEYVAMKKAIEDALALLEPIEQAELRVFKARTFLRDALPK